MADEEYFPPPDSPSASVESIDVGLETIVIKMYINILQTEYRHFAKQINNMQIS